MQQYDVTTNWETRSGVKGFLAKFLFEKAQDYWNSLDLQAFEEIVALLIYELVKIWKQNHPIDEEGHNFLKILQVQGVPTILGFLKQELC